MAPHLACHSPAFLPASPSPLCHNLLRRPRTSRSSAIRPRFAAARRRHPAMQSSPSDPSSSGLSDAFPSVDLTSSRGFALVDAPVHTFADLAIDSTPFETGGAYAISDAAGVVQYMGYSKNMASKLDFHARLRPKSCVSFRIYAPPVPPELISPDLLESVLEYWVREVGDVPRGNSVDRALWEQERPLDRKTDDTELNYSTISPDTATTATAAAAFANSPPKATTPLQTDDVPVRERTTPRRTAPQATDSSRSYPSDPFAESTRPGNNRGSSARSATDAGWEASEDDYVEVDVDPLDPFSATKRRRSTRSAWGADDFDEDEARDDWFPILMICGFAGLVWLFGVLSNALPAATPSLGM